MKSGQIIVAAVALFFVVDLLVDNEDGVLINLQENSNRSAAAGVQPGPPPSPPVALAPVANADPDPWDIAEDTLPSEGSDLIEQKDFANESLGDESQPTQPRALSQPQAGSPEFPYVPLPQPQLAVAGPQIDYPSENKP